MAKTDDPRRRPLLGVLLLIVSLLVGFSVLTSPPWTGVRPVLGLPENACGTVGRVVSSYLVGSLGPPLAVWGALVLFGLSWRALFRRPRRPWLFWTWGALSALLLSIFAGTLHGGDRWGTVPVDAASALASPSFLGSVGAGVVSGGLLLLLGVLGFLRWVPIGARAAAERAAVASGGAVVAGLRQIPRAASRSLVLPERRLQAGGGVSENGGRRRGDPAAPDGRPAGADRRGAARGLEHAPAGLSPSSPVFGSGELGALPLFPSPSAAPAAGIDVARAGRRVRKESAQDSRVRATTTKGLWILPPADLLEKGEPPIGVNREELSDTGRTLVRTLADFGISGQLGQIHPGPVVTQYEYEPAAGVKVAQVVSRAEDLALALRASRIRLVAPIPGKAAIGVEVPNRSAGIIGLRSILQEADLSSIPGELPLILGRDIRGRPYAARLEQMPHLLVAGTTGSGKSVFLNCALVSLLLRRTPEELRLLLIDPKMLELTPYDDIPHLVCPVVTEAKQAARMLTWAVGEMERRYRRLAAVGVRNLEGFREKTLKGTVGEGADGMPHLVIVVDELADLMLTLAAEIEGPIARLAQMARAVGIHLVLATQRPSVDVITGVIKANFPARIAFQVATKVDSRTILDSNGAESLLGRGDMLFLPPGKAEAVRVHGAFVSEADTQAVAEFLRAQPPAPPIYSEDAQGGDESDPELDDDLFEDALRLVVTTRQASTSFLQRRLKVGYSRAGRLMDLLERASAVGPQDGSKTREVLADDAFLARRRERAAAERNAPEDPSRQPA